jgi:opacity protein-like surface antigen
VKLNKVVTVALGLALINQVFAGDGGNSIDHKWRPVVALGLSHAWSNSPGETQTIYLQPELAETWTSNSAKKKFTVGELFLGLQHNFTPTLFAQLGFAAATTTAITLNGEIWQDADPDMNNLTYSYKIKHTRLAVKGKLLTNVHQLVQPYISGSLGVGINRAYNYISTPKNHNILPEAPFASKTTRKLTYTLGAGLQRALNSHWSIGFGYEFSDWGKTSLGAALEQVSNGGLNLNHIYTNQLQFSLSFVA